MEKIILFQGDSITDGGRDRENPMHTGHCYAHFVKNELSVDYPNQFIYYNRGVSGNRIVDLYARLRCDFINLKPDYASILIGVNDVWHGIRSNNGVDTQKFERIYDWMLQEILEECPGIKLMLISPFVVPGTATCDTEEQPDRWERFRIGVAEKAAVTKKMAEKYDLPLIELQPVFDKLQESAPADYWVRDGVHPTEAGYTVIKRLWVDAFRKIL